METDTFAQHLSQHIETSADRITRAWVDRLNQRLSGEAREVLPTERLLNHIPDILRRMAAHVCDSGQEVLRADVVKDIQALAALRGRQGFGVAEVLAEFEILSALVQEEAEKAAATCDGADPEDVVRAVGRLKDSVLLLDTAAARSFHRWSIRQGQERAQTLSWFARMLAHELKNRLGAAQTAAKLLAESGDASPRDKREKLYSVIVDSIDRGLETVTHVSTIASGSEASLPAGPRLPLRTVIEEVIRHLHLEAREAGVRVQLQGEAPTDRTDAGHVQIILMNLISNAIRHHDPSNTDDAWVRVTAEQEVPEGPIRVRVEDNGPGLPDRVIEELRERPPVVTGGDNGSGLGLAIALEAARHLGAELRFETDSGTRVDLLLPVAETGR